MPQTIAAIGEQALLDGFRLAGVSVFAGSTASSVAATAAASVESSTCSASSPASPSGARGAPRRYSCR